MFQSPSTHLWHCSSLLLSRLHTVHVQKQLFASGRRGGKLQANAHRGCCFLDFRYRGNQRELQHRNAGLPVAAWLCWTWPTRLFAIAHRAAYWWLLLIGAIRIGSRHGTTKSPWQIYFFKVAIQQRSIQWLMSQSHLAASWWAGPCRIRHFINDLLS